MPATKLTAVRRLCRQGLCCWATGQQPWVGGGLSTVSVQPLIHQHLLRISAPSPVQALRTEINQFLKEDSAGRQPGSVIHDEETGRNWGGGAPTDVPGQAGTLGGILPQPHSSQAHTLWGQITVLYYISLYTRPPLCCSVM